MLTLIFILKVRRKILPRNQRLPLLKVQRKFLPLRKVPRKILPRNQPLFLLKINALSDHMTCLLRRDVCSLRLVNSHLQDVADADLPVHFGHTASLFFLLAADGNDFMFFIFIISQM